MSESQYESGKDKPVERDEKIYEFSFNVGNTIADIVDADRKKLKQSAFDYLKEKKQSYTGASYIAQLEKNYIYFDCCVNEMANHASLFFLGREVPPSESSIDDVLSQIRFSVMRKSNAFLNFLTAGCDGCDYHDEHQCLNSLRQTRLSNKNAYYEEVEFGCVFNKTSLTIIQSFLNLLWNKHNSHLAGKVKLEREKMSGMIYTYVRNASAYVLKDLPLRKDGSLISYVMFD